MVEFTILHRTYCSIGRGHLSLLEPILRGAPANGKALQRVIIEVLFDDLKTNLPGPGGERTFKEYRQELVNLPQTQYSKRNRNLTVRYLSSVCLGIDLDRQAAPRDREDIFVNNSARIFRDIYQEMIGVLDQQLRLALGSSADFDVEAFISYCKARSGDLPQRNQQLYELWRNGAVITRRPSEDFAPPRDPIPDDEFWKLIASIDQIALEDEHGDEAIQPLLVVLSKLNPEAIESFHCALVEKLFALDTYAHAKGSQETSDDAFLYVRCYTVGRGRDYYERVLREPQSMPIDPP